MANPMIHETGNLEISLSGAVEYEDEPSVTLKLPSGDVRVFADGTARVYIPSLNREVEFDIFTEAIRG